MIGGYGPYFLFFQKPYLVYTVDFRVRIIRSYSYVHTIRVRFSNIPYVVCKQTILFFQKIRISSYTVSFKMPYVVCTFFSKSRMSYYKVSVFHICRMSYIRPYYTVLPTLKPLYRIIRCFLDTYRIS